MRDFKLYSRLCDGETIFEIWNSSTKHPDVTFYFSKFEKSPFTDEPSQIFPWLLECASKMFFLSSSWRIANFAMELWDNLETR